MLRKLLTTFTVLLFLLLPGVAMADNESPYLTWQAEDFSSEPACTTEISDGTASGTASHEQVRIDAGAANCYETNTGIVTNGGYLKVRARGSSCNGVYPHLHVQIGGTDVLDTVVTGSWANYFTPLSKVVPSSTGSALAFVSLGAGDNNEGCAGRYLRLDKVDWYLPWEPYASSSVWNTTVASKIAGSAGSVTSTTGNTSEFGARLTVEPGDDAQKPIYFATAADTSTSLAYLRTSSFGWNTSDTAYDGGAIPIVNTSDCFAAADHSDGHLIIVSADKQTTWAFWQAREQTGTNSQDENGLYLTSPPSDCTDPDDDGVYYEARNGSQWDTSSTGTGVASCCGSATGRGSGTELIASVLRANDVYYGYSRAVGCDVSAVNKHYLNPPAIKTDEGSNTTRTAEYGQLWKLDDSFPEADFSVGELEIIHNLKTYGCYIVDKGSGRWEINVDNHDMATWATAGVDVDSFSGATGRGAALTPSYMHLVSLNNQTEH